MYNQAIHNGEEDKLIDFGYYFHLIKTRRVPIFIFTTLVTVIAVLVILSLKPTYKASAMLLIDSSTNKAVSIEEVVGFDTNAKEYYQTQVEILKSNSVALRVINKLELSKLNEFNPEEKGEGLKGPRYEVVDNYITSHPLLASYFSKVDGNDATLIDRDDLIKRKVLSTFKQKMTISPIRNTHLVKISFESEDPKLAATIANEIGLAFIANNLEAKLFATEQATGWINQRLEKLKQKLDYSEQQLLLFLEQQELIDDSGIIALTSSELSNLTKRIANATDRRIETQALYNALQINKNADVSTLSSIPQISNHPQIRDIRLSESNAEKVVSELSKRYGPKHDKMIRANAQLASIQKRARNVVRTLINGIEKELSSAKNQEILLKRELLEKKEEFQSLSILKREYDALKREVETNTKLYDLFLTRQKEASATSDFSSENASISDYALVPGSPSKPNKKLLVFVVMMASASFAIVMVIVVDAFNDKLKSARDFENKLGLLPTGVVPFIKDKIYKKSPLDSKVFHNVKHKFFQESFNSIRTSLLLSLQNTGRNILVISSPLPGEGKSTASINLALSFSKLEKVLLIDCDLRKPSIASRFGLNAYQPGLTNILLMNTSLEESVVSIPDSNLDILTSGMTVPNPQEILSSSSFNQLMNRLVEEYDRIIIDSPPVLPVKDAFILGSYAKGVILVVKANSTSKSVFKHVMTMFSKYDINLDGVILNQVISTQEGTHAYSECESYYYHKGLG